MKDICVQHSIFQESLIASLIRKADRKALLTFNMSVFQQQQQFRC